MAGRANKRRMKMKKIFLMAVGLMYVFVAGVYALDAKFTKEYAQNLLKTVDKSMYPQIFKSNITMSTFRNGRQPLVYTYEIYSKGQDKSLMKIVAPARDKGKKILLNGDNLWMYMPDVSRPIRLSRKQAFMGSTFSNEDLADSGWADNYSAEITQQKGDMILLALSAKKNDVAYAKIEMWIDDTTKVPTEAVYFGLSGKAIKKMIFSNPQTIAGLLRPLDMKMEDLLEEGAYTEVKMLKMEELQSVPDYMFDQTQMGR
jgi:outer membrane lipoprotein-sorting protein